MVSSSESECPRERQMVDREFSQATPLSNPIRASVCRMIVATNRSRRRKAERRRSRQQNTYAFLSTTPSLSNTYPRHPRVTRLPPIPKAFPGRREVQEHRRPLGQRVWIRNKQSSEKVGGCAESVPRFFVALDSTCHQADERAYRPSRELIRVPLFARS